jgi:predicted protein tyrosine phosphatase
MISIMSRREAAEVIASNPNYPIIAIGETTSDDVDEKIVSKAKNCLCLKFDDIEFERTGYKIVEAKQIRQAIEWAKDKDKLIVACRAGISRSSAMAYLIAASKEGPQEAINILDMSVHQPNPLVIGIGSAILGQEIQDVFDEWIKKFYQQYI